MLGTMAKHFHARGTACLIRDALKATPGRDRLFSRLENDCTGDVFPAPFGSRETISLFYQDDIEGTR